MKEKSEFLEFAVELATEAGDLIMKFHDQRQEPIWTSSTHFKTVADDTSDKLIRDEITKRFPGHSIYSEEGGYQKKESQYAWVVDSLDGTMNFITPFTDHFAVCISLCEEKTPIIGVVNAPKRKELYYAEHGKGAFCNDVPIRVSSKIKDIQGIDIGLDSGKYERIKHIPYMEKLIDTGQIARHLSTGCASVPLVLVASGVIPSYLATSLNPEDMAAAVCIIREAGGKVTNLQGKEWQLGDASILAANPVLHQKLSEFFGII